jgi:hypothetical protein
MNVLVRLNPEELSPTDIPFGSVFDIPYTLHLVASVPIWLRLGKEVDFEQYITGDIRGVSIV